MRVYVINQRKEPLMPTYPSKARKLLLEGKAKMHKRTPFTIQLLYPTGENKQAISLGIDAGSKVVGLSATTEKKELYSSETELRNDIVKLLATRAQNRRTRRSRLRYRKARFLNRVSRKKKGWLAPSIEHKIQTHFRIVYEAHKLLPISKVIVETASFDIQKVKDFSIQGVEYQQGDQMGFWNVREYVLFRDNHVCQHCKGKSKDCILEVHHIQSRKIGGDAPNNLITLCSTCHDAYHKGKLELNFKRGQSFRDATFMGIMRWSFYNRLKDLYPNVSMTYGYITKNTRIENELPKEHRVDARCICGNPTAEPLDNWFYQKKVRCHNRQTHKAKILKGGKKRNNQAAYEVKGFRLFDKVEYNNEEYFIFGRREKGSFLIRGLANTRKVEITPKKLNFLETRKTLLIERRQAVPSHD